MSAITTRRRFLGGIAAITVLPSLPLPAFANPWRWAPEHVAMLDEAVDGWTGPITDLGGVAHWKTTERYSVFGIYPNAENDLRPFLGAKMKHA